MRTPTKLQTAAVGVLLAWDNHMFQDADQREVVALAALRDANSAQPEPSSGSSTA